MAAETVGTELEHAIGFNGGVPGGLYILPSHIVMRTAGAATSDIRDERYVVSAGACVVVNSMTDPHEQTFFRGHRGAISAMALSSTVRAAVWGALPGLPFRSFAHARFPPTKLQGRLLATGESGFDADVVVWDVVSARVLLRYEEVDHGLAALAFSPDERLLLIAGVEADGWLHIVDLSTGGIVWRHRHDPAPTLSVAWGGFVRDARGRESALYSFATGGAKGVTLWALQPVTGECEGARIGRPVAQSLARDVLCLVWSPHADKAWLYSGTASGDIVISHVPTRDVFHATPACSGGVTSIVAVRDYASSGSARYLPQGPRKDFGGGSGEAPEAVNVLVVAGGGDGSITVWSHAISSIDSEALLSVPQSAAAAEAAAMGRPALAQRTFNMLRTVKLDGPCLSLAPLTPPAGRQGLALLAGTSSGTLHRVYASENGASVENGPAGSLGAASRALGTSARHAPAVQYSRAAGDRAGAGAIAHSSGGGSGAGSGLQASIFRQAHACDADGFDPSQATVMALAARPGGNALPAPAAAGGVNDVSFAPGLNDKVLTVCVGNWALCLPLDSLLSLLSCAGGQRQHGARVGPVRLRLHERNLRAVERPSPRRRLRGRFQPLRLGGRRSARILCRPAQL